MYDLNKSRKKIFALLSNKQREKYYQLVRSWGMFKTPISKIQFDTAVRQILRSEEQLKAHNQFMLAIMERRNMSEQEAAQACIERGTCTFDKIDVTEYMETTHSDSMPNMDKHKSATLEFFFPDICFISNRIHLHAWENGLDGVDKAVPEYVANLCQTFIKNILTAMISKKETYKIRDKHFQYGFGLPAPNPLLRNSNNIVDTTKESKVDYDEEADSFMPTFKPSIDTIEQQTAFAYACGTRTYTGEKLTVKLLYETLRENPNIVGIDSINSTNLLKLGLLAEET